MSDTSRKLHSCIFGSKNTWDDWHMIPVKRPFIENAKVKWKSVDLPASDGEIDYTTALLGYPTYENRKGKLKFRLVDNREYKSVLSRRNEIAAYVHGRYRVLTLEDEPQYYYQGRFEMTDNIFKGKGDWVDIEIEYNLEPYKYLDVTSTEDWLWDTFSFDTGVIQPMIFKDIETNSSDWKYIDNLDFYVGNMAVYPVIDVTVDSNKTVEIQCYSSRTKTWNQSETYDHTQTDNSSSIVFDMNTTRLRYRGFGTISIDFRSGRI